MSLEEGDVKGEALPIAPTATSSPPPLYGVATDSSPGPTSDAPILGYSPGGEEPLLDGSSSKMTLNASSAWSLVLLGGAGALAQASIFCAHVCPGETAFAIAAGAISTAICIFQLLLVKPGTVVLDETAEHVVAGFLCLWWIITALVTTFDTPFRGTSNGYFGTWAATIGSFYLCYCKGGKFKELVDRFLSFHQESTTISYILLASIIETIGALF